MYGIIDDFYDANGEFINPALLSKVPEVSETFPKKFS